jgi:hypothetical protein
LQQIEILLHCVVDKTQVVPVLLAPYSAFGEQQ